MDSRTSYINISFLYLISIHGYLFQDVWGNFQLGKVLIDQAYQTRFQICISLHSPFIISLTIIHPKLYYLITIRQFFFTDLLKYYKM